MVRERTSEGKVQLSRRQNRRVSHIFNEGGWKEEEISYEDGEEESRTQWHENGQLKVKFPYQDGKIEGLAIIFNEGGWKEKEISYSNDVKNGIATEWYENGEMKSESEYKNDKLNGVRIDYDMFGIESRRRFYSNGIQKIDYKARQ